MAGAVLLLSAITVLLSLSPGGVLFGGDTRPARRGAVTDSIRQVYLAESRTGIR